MDTEWHAGNCDPNKAILRHQDTLPEEWIQVRLQDRGSVGVDILGCGMCLMIQYDRAIPRFVDCVTITASHERGF